MVTAANITGCSDVVGGLLYRFLWFLRAGEFTGSAQEKPSLTVSDVTVDLHSSPSFVSLHLCHSKTKPGRYIDIIVVPRYNFIIVAVYIALFIITKYNLNQVTTGTAILFNSR